VSFRICVVVLERSAKRSFNSEVIAEWVLCVYVIQRFNVAVTRAKALLIVVGNPHLLSKDLHWNRSASVLSSVA